MKRRLKRKPIIILFSIILCIIGILCLIKHIEYKKSDTYKLKEKGYTEIEIKLFKEKLKTLDFVLKEKYNKKIPIFIKQKYFLEKNLKTYIQYQKENPLKKEKEIVTVINIGLDKEVYEDSVNADTSKKEKILVNKYYYLEENYPNEEELVTIPSKYAYANVKINKEAYEMYKEMWENAKEKGITLIATSGYRSYTKQRRIYNSYSNQKGEIYADKMIAHPGFSETQTGLAINIRAKGITEADFKDTDAYKWLQENAANFGFILRYPEGKENITLFNYEPCHYRYVGKEVAKKIKKENITLEEYHAYYLK